MNFPAQVAFDRVAVVDVPPDLGGLVVGEIAHLGVAIEAECVTDVLRPGQADSIDVGEADLDPLVAWEVYSSDTSHVSPAFACAEGFRRSPKPGRAGG